MRGLIRTGATVALCLMAAALPVPLLAQWTGEIGGGYIWQDVTGNEDAFITQYGQYQGFVLDSFELTYVPSPGDRETFAVKAWGFGGAEPAQHGSILFRTACDWTFNLTYDRQSYFYGIAEGDLASRRSKWAMERWKGSIVFDGWSAARLTLDLRYYKKSGYVYRGMFGQNYVVFPSRNNYDQDMKEAAIRIETKTLPVYIAFEQAYARYERQDRWEAAGRYPVFGTSGSTLASVSTPRNDKTNIPSSRLIMAYHDDVVDVSGSLFYSKQSMDNSGPRQTVYDAFAHSGQFQWLDETKGSATQDTRAGNVDARFHLGAGWSIGFAGDYRDSTQDSSQWGADILRLGKPGGFWQDFATQVDEKGFFDVKDTTGRFDIMKQGFGWAVWAGYLTGARDVSWKREADDPGTDVRRTGDGWLVGGTWSRSPKLRVNAEYEHGTFDNFVFRTDPDMVEKFTFKLTSSLGSGWTIGARARWEWAENPANVALAKRAAQAYGANVSWANKEGSAGVGLTADMLTIDTRTDIEYPGRVPGLSVYNVDLLTVTANGYFTVGKVHVSGDLTRLRDAGSTWPLTNWSADLRAAIDGPKGVQFEIFGQYRSYVEDLSSLDNYYARRYGVIIRWRF